MRHELHGGHGEGEEARQLDQRISIIDRMRRMQPGTKSSIAGGVSGLILGAGLSTGLYYSLKDLPYPDAYVRLTLEGAQEVIVDTRPIEAKCKDIGKSVSVDLRRDVSGNPTVAVFDCNAIEPTK